MNAFFIFSLMILIFVADIDTCVGNEIQKTIKEEEINSSGIANEIKEEIVSEYETEIKFFVDVPRRKRSMIKKGLLPNNSPFPSSSARYTKEEQINIIIGDEHPMPDVVESSVGHYCDHCKIQFRFASVYENHFRENHPDKPPYSCPFCYVTYNIKQTFSRHMSSHHPQHYRLDNQRIPRFKEIKCELCDTTHRGVYALEKHSLQFHKEVKTNKCPDCFAKFFRSSDMGRHILLKHRYPKADHPFLCKFCNTLFRRSDELEEHEPVCHKKHKLEKKSGIITVDAASLEKLNQRTICNTCGAYLRTMAQLMKHVRVNHPEVKGIFICEICKKTFSQSQNLEKHINKFHTDMKEFNLRKRSRMREKFGCQFCGMEFVGVSKYEMHVKIAHPSDCPFRCLSCDRGFPKKSNLMEHMKNIHAPMKLLACMYCAKHFGSRTSLKCHEKNCGELKITCSNCAKYFGFKRDVKFHEKTCGKERTKKKAFFCEFCFNWFSGSEKEHMLNHDQFNYCEFCHRRFHKEKNPEGLSKHMTKKHPNRLNEGLNALLAAVEITNSSEREVKIEKE